MFCVLAFVFRVYDYRLLSFMFCCSGSFVVCTNVQPEFRLLIMFDYGSIRFGTNMTNTFVAPINITFPCSSWWRL